MLDCFCGLLVSRRDATNLFSGSAERAKAPEKHMQFT